MKKLSLLLMVIAAAVMMGCGGGKYGDAKAVTNKYINVVEAYLNDLEKADNAKEVASAINQFADDLEKVWPEMKKMSEKYPELKDQSNPPPEMKEEQERAMTVGLRMGQSFSKIGPFMSDPDVQKAQARLMKVMES